MSNSNITRVLWYSDENMTTEHMDDLRRIYGPIIVSHFSGCLKNVQELVRLGKLFEADVFACVLPMNILAELTNPAINIKPVIRALYRRVPTGRKVLHPITLKQEDEYTFKPDGWEQVLQITMNTKRLDCT